MSLHRSPHAGDAALEQWLESYAAEHRDELDSDPDFARWLAEEYVPIAGSWHY